MASSSGRSLDGADRLAASALVLSVLLWEVPGRGDALIAYEDAVLPLLSDHGGQVLSRARRSDDGDGPLETHLLEFPDEAALDAYLADPRRTALGAQRDGAIARTELQRVESI